MKKSLLLSALLLAPGLVPGVSQAQETLKVGALVTLSGAGAA